MSEITEYACRWTGWGGDVATGRTNEQVTKYDLCGTGEQGLMDARRIAESTRLWQPRQGLPVDAVVVSRPVPEWMSSTATADLPGEAL